MPTQVGFLLVNSKDKSEHGRWGGVWGQMVSSPNSVRLPSGLAQVHCAEIGVDYTDFDGQVYSLQPWMMEDPDLPPPRDALAELDALKAALITKGVVDHDEIAEAATALADAPVAIKKG